MTILFIILTHNNYINTAINSLLITWKDCAYTCALAAGEWMGSWPLLRCTCFTNRHPACFILSSSSHSDTLGFPESPPTIPSPTKKTPIRNFCISTTAQSPILLTLPKILWARIYDFPRRRPWTMLFRLRFWTRWFRGVLCERWRGSKRMRCWISWWVKACSLGYF